MVIFPKIPYEETGSSKAHWVAGKDCLRIGDAEMAHHDLPEDVAKIGRDGQVAAFVALVDSQAGPPPVDLATFHPAADDHHGVAVTVVGAAVAVFATARPNSDMVSDHGVGHPIAKVGDKRSELLREIVQPRGELPLASALVDVGIPAADVRERDLETDVGFGELRDLLGAPDQTGCEDTRRRCSGR